MMGEQFVQEAFVGYKYGTFSKLGLVTEHTPLSAYPQSSAEEENKDDMEVDEQSSGPRDLTQFNMDKFLAAVHNQSLKSQED